MQAYGPEFASVYNRKWSAFSNRIAPPIIEFYESTPVGKSNMSVLDLCCGAGHLAVHLLRKGFHVTGVDLSEHMLEHARENARNFLESGQAHFICADASNFALKERFGLVLSVYDSLNHLESEDAMRNCFECVYKVTDFMFIFDINTRRGLANWNMTHVDDSDPDLCLIRQGEFQDAENRACLKITGYKKSENGLFLKFEEVVYNTVFDLGWVKKTLLDFGFSKVHFARIDDLSTPLENPEAEGRVFVVATA